MAAKRGKPSIKAPAGKPGKDRILHAAERLFVILGTSFDALDAFLEENG